MPNRISDLLDDVPGMLREADPIGATGELPKGYGLARGPVFAGDMARSKGENMAPNASKRPRIEKKQFALGRLRVGEKNATEAAYERELEIRRRNGELSWYKFEGLKFRLADNTFYTPDFAVMLACGEIELHEVKGYWEDDARVKIKVAASLYPFRFIGVKKRSAKDGGGWKQEAF